MLQELKGKNVIVYLRLSVWGDSVTKGNVLELDDYWLKLEGKKEMEFIKISSIKKIVLRTK